MKKKETLTRKAFDIWYLKVKVSLAFFLNHDECRQLYLVWS